MKNLYKIEDELYVVSNNEDISENCWIITNGKLVQVSYLLSDEVAKEFKVILTTNKLLIKDSVQAIDNEFLEWFVKNPSCEFINIEELYFHGSGYYKASELSEQEKEKYSFMKTYKIVIPKKEPKTKCYCGHTTYCDCGVDVDFEIKQETLEEAKINNLIKLFGKDFDLEPRNVIESCNDSFIEGVKWQQERMYSEDDMIMFADFFHNYKELLKKEKWEILEISKEDVFKKWKQI